MKVKENTKPKKQKNFKILNIFVVTIISFVAFIIIVDTFKYPIGKIVPNVNLYFIIFMKVLKISHYLLEI